MAFRLTPPQIQFLDQDGNPLVGGQLSFFITGTSTPAQTFADAKLTIGNPNPIILDASGSCPAPFLLPTQEYRVTLEDGNGAQVYTVDPVSDPTSTGANISSPLNVLGAAGTSRVLAFQTEAADGQGQNRFTLGLNAVAEGGNDSGSNLVLTTCNDDGSNDTQVMTVNRASGQVDFLKPPTFGGAGLLPSGAVVPFAMEKAPSGWLFCDGSAISRTTYAGLFNAIGTTYGAGDDTTTFNLPNLQGQFVRGFDVAQTTDVGRTFGTGQADAIEAFTVKTTVPASGNTGGLASASGANVAAQPTNAVYTAAVTDSATGGAIRTASETRPVNVALYYCIKT